MLLSRYRALAALMLACALAALSGCGSPSLAGTQWNLAAIEQGGASQPPIPGTQPTLQFGADASVAGTAGCNSFGGEYIIAGPALTITELNQTLIGCDAPILQQEERYMALLREAQSFTLAGSELRLTSPAGTLRFTRA
jgi:heat shock protein HslJ